MDPHIELAEYKVRQLASTWRRWGLSLFPWVRPDWGEKWPGSSSGFPPGEVQGGKAPGHMPLWTFTPHLIHGEGQPSPPHTRGPHNTRGCCQGPAGAAGQLGATRLSKETMVHPGPLTTSQYPSLSQSPHQLSGDNSTCSASPFPPGLL